MRRITQTYTDPVDLIWTHAAAQMGMRIERSAEVNASWDGSGVLTIGTAETLDPDDSLAQMVLHEVCHHLCEGPESWELLDWGLGGVNPVGKVHEHACLRLQAALADAQGMRNFFASTTQFRTYYDKLPADPLADSADPAIALATAGWRRAQEEPYRSALNDALSRTAQIAQLLEGVAPSDSLWCP